jgi:molybdopterin-containing oxidoreductase family membrane subunit
MKIYGIEIPEKERFKETINAILKGKGGTLTYISLIGIILGVYAVARIVIEGHGYTTNTNSQVPWGLQITTYIFLVLNGCTFINLIGNYFFKKEYEPYALKVVFFGIFAALSGMGALATELGHVERLYLWALSPNPASMMWWMAVWYTIYLTSIIIEFINLKRHKHSKTLTWITFLSALATSSTLGALLGTVEQRPYYYSALLPIYLPLISFLMGGIVLTIMSSLSAKKSPSGTDPLLKPAVNSFKVGLGIFFFATIWRLIVGSYGQAEGFDIFEMALNTQILIVLLVGTVLPLYYSFNKQIS